MVYIDLIGELERSAMRLINGSVTLVVAGAWNSAVLTPAWVAKYGLGLEGDVAVKVTAPINAVLGTVNSTPAYTLPSLTYSLTPGALILTPVSLDTAALTKVQSAAIAMLSALTHTPVAAVGYNAAFEADDVDHLLGAFGTAQVDVVDAAPDGWASAGNRIQTILSKGGDELNITKTYDGKVLQVRFNFNYPVTGTEGAMAALGRMSFWDALDQAKVIAGKILSEDLNDDGNHSN